MPARNNRGYLPDNPVTLRFWALRFVEACTTYQTLLQIPAEQLQELAEAVDAYAQAVARAADKNRRSRSDVFRRNSLRGPMCDLIRRVVKHAQGSPMASMEVLISLGLRPATVRRRKVAPPDLAPNLIVRALSVRMVEIFIQDRTRLSSRSKATDAAGASVFFQIGGRTNPGDRWHFIGNTTRTRLRFNVPDTGSADRVWFCAQWYSNRGEKSPMSQPQYADIVAGNPSPIALPLAA